VHARADRYPEPRDFRPERFLDDSPPDTYTWIPFGGGVRRCLGASFALFEMRVVMERVLERAALVAAEPEPDAAERRGLTLAHARGLPSLPSVPRKRQSPRPTRARLTSTLCTR